MSDDNEHIDVFNLSPVPGYPQTGSGKTKVCHHPLAPWPRSEIRNVVFQLLKMYPSKKEVLLNRVRSVFSKRNMTGDPATAVDFILHNSSGRVTIEVDPKTGIYSVVWPA